MCLYISNTYHLVWHTGCCVFTIFIWRTSSVGYGEPCKMCLKILPILLDFLFTYFWKVHVFPTWATFPFLCESWPPTVTFLDSSSSHTAFTVVAGHIFPEIPGTFVILSLFYSSVLHIFYICLKSSLVVTYFSFLQKLFPRITLLGSKADCFFSFHHQIRLLGKMFFTVYKSNGSKNLFKRHLWYFEVSSSNTQSTPTPISHLSATKYEQILLLIRCSLWPGSWGFKPVQWNYLFLLLLNRQWCPREEP